MTVYVRLSYLDLGPDFLLLYDSEANSLVVREFRLGVDDFQLAVDHGQELLPLIGFLQLILFLVADDEFRRFDGIHPAVALHELAQALLGFLRMDGAIRLQIEFAGGAPKRDQFRNGMRPCANGHLRVEVGKFNGRSEFQVLGREVEIALDEAVNLLRLLVLSLECRCLDTDIRNVLCDLLTPLLDAFFDGFQVLECFNQFHGSYSLLLSVIYVVCIFMITRVNMQNFKKQVHEPPPFLLYTDPTPPPPKALLQSCWSQASGFGAGGRTRTKYIKQ